MLTLRLFVWIACCSINNVDSLKALLEIKPNEEVLIAFAMGITKNEYFRPAVKENRKVIFK